MQELQQRATNYRAAVARSGAGTELPTLSWRTPRPILATEAGACRRTAVGRDATGFDGFDFKDADVGIRYGVTQMRGFLLPAITLTSLLAGSAAFSGQTSGLVGSYDRHERSFWITGQKYQLPETSRKHPVNGDTVSVQYDQQAGVRMVRLFTIDKTSSDD